MSHFFGIEALPWLLPHPQRHPHWSPSSRWQEVIGSCRWAKTLLLALRLISFRCVIDPHHPSHRIHHCTFLLERVFLSSVRIQNRLSRKPIFLMRLLYRPKQMKNPIHLPWNYRYPNRLLGALWGWMPRYLAPLRYTFNWVIWLFVYQRRFMRSFRFWSSLFLK